MIKKKGQFCTIFFLFILAFSLTTVSAHILEHHIDMSQEALSKTSSAITAEILAFEDYYHLGNELTDISVVGYFTIDAEQDAGFLSKLLNLFTFNIGRTYRATHSQNACLRALDQAENQKQRVIGYGICSHMVQDSVSHNNGVPASIEKTNLYNGVLHSIKEIHDKDIFTTPQQRVYSREILDLAYEEEVLDYFERVFVQDPAFSDVNIRGMIDFFVRNVQPNAQYQLGFRSFFALPAYIYWMILFIFLFSISLAGVAVRRIRDGQRDASTFFTAFFFFILLAVTGTAIAGLLMGNVWSIWEKLSQFLFSPAMYPIGALMLAIGFFLIYSWVVKKEKVKNLGTISVALFILLVGGYVLTLPTGLTIGNEQALHDVAVQNTVNFLNLGSNAIRTIEDPVGFVALRDATAHGSGARSGFLVVILILLGTNVYFTLRRRR